MKRIWRRVTKIRHMTLRKKVSLWLLTAPIFILLNCTNPYQQGQRLYTANCERCHGRDGEGFEDLYPSLVQSGYIQNKSPYLSCIILHGSHFLESHRESHSIGGMPENPHLSPIEILNITNYLYHKFEIDYTEKISTVESSLEECDHN